VKTEWRTHAWLEEFALRTKGRGSRSRFADRGSFLGILAFCAALATGIPAVAASPTITNVSSTTGNGTYGAGAVIAITVGFSSVVDVTGTPQLALNSGGTASYASGSGASTLTFVYSVSAGQNSSLLDYASTTALTLNGGTIADSGNNAATLTLPAPGAVGSLGANKNIVIDTLSPVVNSVSSTTANGTYGVGSVISITVTFSSVVEVTGTPQLALNSGGTASFAFGSGTSTLGFVYTVSAGQNSSHLDYTSTTALTLNGGTVAGTGNNEAVLTLPTPGAAGSLSANKNIIIDTLAPTITNLSSTTANGTYGLGAVINITVAFSTIVNVTGTPQLALNSGGTSSYASGSGTNTLTFVYTVGAGQNSSHLDYSSTMALKLNGGTIADVVNNAANLTLPTPGAAGSLSANKNIVINTTPTVTSVSSTTANGTYSVGAVIIITVTFSNNVNVTGTPQLALNSGGTASYASGSGSSTLNFVYTVEAGQNSPHLDYTSTTALTLNGGTIMDTGGDAASLTLPTPGAAGSLFANKNIAINTTSATVISYSVIFGSAGIYNVSANAASRNRLPWMITGIQVVFSAPIASGDVNSLTGVSTTGFSGLGTNTLTWTISPISLASVSTTLAGSGADAIKDFSGNGLNSGSGFTQNFKVLLGDYNDDGIVNSADTVNVNLQTTQPYNIFADLNGDGVVNVNDVRIARSMLGASLP